MTPFAFGQQLAGRMKTAGWFDDAKQLGGQMWDNSARAFKGMTGATAGAIGAGTAGLAAGGMQGINAIGGAFGQKPVFSDETINTAHNTADTYANIGSAYGQDFANSMGMGAQGLAGTAQSGSQGDAAWKNLLQQPGVSDGARDFSNRAFNVVDTAAKIAPAAAIGGVNSAIKPFQAANAAAAPVTQAAATASRVPSALKPALNVAQKAQQHWGTANKGGAGMKMIDSALSAPK
jgi:hypothetical protein